VEAAGIEPGQFDDLYAVSPRHLAQVRDPPGEMGGPRALSRVANRHPAGSVDQRDHGVLEHPSRLAAAEIDHFQFKGGEAAGSQLPLCRLVSFLYRVLLSSFCSINSVL
jgi:hypothetical protein